MTITYKCTNCGDEFEIEATPFVPAKIHGPPELCHPAEGGEFEPGLCPQCGQEVNEDEVYRKMDDEIIAARENHAEAMAELAAERRAEERERNR